MGRALIIANSYQRALEKAQQKKASDNTMFSSLRAFKASLMSGFFGRPERQYLNDQPSPTLKAYRAKRKRLNKISALSRKGNWA